MVEPPPQPIENRTSLTERVKDWLSTEGFPLEFKTAAAFRAAGFRVWQGQHVRDGAAGTQREIDVLAERTADIGGAYVRTYHVVECKWSRDRPWVVFTSGGGAMMPSACIAQTIAAKAGDALLWAVAGDPALHALDYFSTPKRPGFAGRQAFTKGQDAVYSALQSVTSVATLAVKRYDETPRSASATLEWAAIAFPVIVVDGELFEAFFSGTGDVQVEAVSRVRLHWRGSEAWPLNASIDIVRASEVEAFAVARSHETEQLLSRLGQSLKELRDSFTQRNPKLFGVTKGPRGRQGVPPLLIELQAELKAVSKGRRVISPGV